ncbi:hypothetical protein J2W18_003916 [Rhodococcus cercidiphylli]|nr:hypothetical protein [Rhodococcus cercidiphylli]
MTVPLADLALEAFDEAGLYQPQSSADGGFDALPVHAVRRLP